MSTRLALTRAIQCVSVIAAAGGASTALAQQPPPSDSPQVEEVIVTGTRIISPNMTSTSPIQVVTSQEIQQQGRADIADVIAQLPQNFASTQGQGFSNRTSGLNSAGGVTTADLRGLGPQRTLVLVNGRRLGPGTPSTIVQAPAPDLSQIPMALVERVDVVTGGASAVYGSDAIAGVINFVMKRNFEGLQLDYQMGENWDSNDNSFTQRLNRDFGVDPISGTSKDGRNVKATLLAGTNFADGRGNITAYFTYLQADPVVSGDRDYGQCQITATLADNFDAFACSGSGNSNRYTIGGAEFAVVGNEFQPWSSAATTTPPPFFNSQRYISISRDDERYTGGFIAHMELNDYVEPYLEFSFMNDRTNQVIAPSGLFETGNVLTLDNLYPVNCGNPFLSVQQRTVMGCTGDPNQLVSMDIGRRNIEGIDRESNYEHTNYRGVIGARGEFAEAFSWDAYGQYYYTTLYQENTGYLNLQNVANALIATIDPETGQPACVSGAGCVPWNLFQEGGVTDEQLQYLYAAGTQKGDITEQILHGDITVDLGVWNLRSPLAQEGFAFNVGWERRSQKFEFAPDFAAESGLLSGAGGASVSIDERYVVNEQFIEARFPILEDKPGADYLAFDVGYRRSDYTTIGVVNTHKFQLQYSPIEDVRLRGSYQKAIRAPSLIELFNPQLVGKIAFGEDPCAPSEANPTAPLAATFEECARTGVTQAQYDNRSIPQGTAQQLSQLQGGNPDLTEETADSYTIGITFNPSFLPEFSGSLDYFNIKIEDQVGALPANIIMDNCRATGDPTFCSQLVRSPITGTLDGATVESGGYIVQTSVNIGEAEATGLDAQAAYRLPMAGFGDLVFSLWGTYLLDNKVTPIPGGGTYDCAGLFGPVCLNVNPEWRHNFRILWSSPWDVDVSLLWRYFSGVKLDNNDSNPLLFGTTYGQEVTYHDEIGSYSYFDLFARWRVRDELSIRAGMNNIFDKDPPLIANELVAGGSPNTYETYDTLGRQWYVGFTAYFGPQQQR